MTYSEDKICTLLEESMNTTVTPDEKHQLWLKVFLLEPETTQMMLTTEETPTTTIPFGEYTTQILIRNLCLKTLEIIGLMRGTSFLILNLCQLRLFRNSCN